MKVITDHISLKSPRFICQLDNEKIAVPVTNEAGNPAKYDQLNYLRNYAGPEYLFLKPLYSAFNGIMFHVADVTAGLVIAPIEEIEVMNDELQDWLEMSESEDLADFQKHGVAFATIESSGNYFVIYQGKIYYADHDDFNDVVFAQSLEEFFTQALSNPAEFLNDAGCYTRYSDGKSNKQYIPKQFIHD